MTCNSDFLIKRLPKDRFKSFIKWMDKSDGHSNPVFVATLQHPDPEVGLVTAYCKIYAHRTGNRSLINEITGYLFAHACGVPQPQNAFIAQIPISKLQDVESIFGDDHWLLKNQLYPAFCTTRLDGKSAAVYFSESDKYLMEDISKWPDLPRTVALDENIAHTDRHLNNLMRIGRRKYAAIDNGRLVCEDNDSWTTDMLLPKKLYRNRLSEKIWNHKPNKNVISHILLHAKDHEMAIDHIKDELLYWSKMFIPEPLERNAFQDFLEQRTKMISTLIAQRYQSLV